MANTITLTITVDPASGPAEIESLRSAIDNVLSEHHGDGAPVLAVGWSSVSEPAPEPAPAAPVLSASQVGTAIVRVLAETDDPISLAEIADAVPGATRRRVSNALGRLLRSGDVVRVLERGHGVRWALDRRPY